MPDKVSCLLKGDHNVLKIYKAKTCCGLPAQSLPGHHMRASCSLPEEDEGCPQPLLGSESLEWDAIPNLDDFFSRVYK